MDNPFRTIRACLLGTTACWTLIVLGIAIHFQTSFVESASELTYVSLAVFVSAVTLALFLLLLVAPCNKKLGNLLQTKWEVVWLGILSVLWLSLAGYTTSPHAKDSEVECWDEDEDTGAIVALNVDGYSNSVYHARYRALQASAFFNAILLLLLFLFILLFAFWHHKRGRFVIWTTPTTSVGWFDRGINQRRLHLPITIVRNKSYEDEPKDEKKRGKWTEFNQDDDWEEEKPRKKKAADEEDPIRRPQAAQIKPRQYMVNVPLTETVKPSLAPIAAKMTSPREESSRPQPVRTLSQREIADAARAQARRERAAEEELNRRPSRKDRKDQPEEDLTRRPSQKRTANTSKDDQQPKVTVVRNASFKMVNNEEKSSASNPVLPPGLPRPDPTSRRRVEPKPAVAQNTRPSATTARPTQAESSRRQPTTQPAIVRSNSGGAAVRNNTTNTTQQSRGRTTTTQQPTNPNVQRQPSLPRTPGRRI